MSWFIIAIGAPFLWAMVNIFDQYLVKKYSIGEKGSGGLVLFSSLIGVLASIIIWIFAKNVFQIPLQDKLLLILTGGLTIFWVIIYLYTIEIEDVSFVSPWFSMVPVFGYILGYIFLGETLTSKQLLGSLIVIIGVVLISIDFSIKEKHKFKWKPALYMSIACLVIAIAGIIFKYVTVEENFWVASFWEYFGLGIFGILIYILVPKYRKEFNFMNKMGGVKIFTLNILGEFMTIAGNLMTNFAILLAPVALVYLVGSFQPVVVLILVIIGTKFFPHIVTEKIHKQVLVPKIIAIVIIVVGSVFLFV